VAVIIPVGEVEVVPVAGAVSGVVCVVVVVLVLVVAPVFFVCVLVVRSPVRVLVDCVLVRAPVVCVV
jgi:hypothetical protein